LIISKLFPSIPLSNIKLTKFSNLQMGHQAAQCSVGTVNWKNIYGPEAFLLRRPVFWSEIEAAMKAKTIDFKSLEAKAKEYAEARRQGKVPGAVAAPVPPPPQQDPDLPLGWAAAKDSEGKTYYWHRETKKVQWNKPTLEGVEAAAPPAAAGPPAEVKEAEAADGEGEAVKEDEGAAMQE
jgi:WW domain